MLTLHPKKGDTKQYKQIRSKLVEMTFPQNLGLDIHKFSIICIKIWFVVKTSETKEAGVIVKEEVVE